MTRMTARRWAELVEGWQASGEAARVYAGEHGVAESSLRWWKGELARRARREAPRRSPGAGRNGRDVVALARVVREGEGPPATADTATAAIVVAIGAARILVTRGFDAHVLRGVVRALGEES